MCKAIHQTLKSKKEQLAEETNRVARLQGDLSDVQGEFAGADGDSAVQNKIETSLTSALQSLTEEMMRLQESSVKKNDAVGGIPVDSEYIIFIRIDVGDHGTLGFCTSWFYTSFK